MTTQFTITPNRTNTMTELIYIFIKENNKPNRINTLINTFSQESAKSLNAFFWIALFRRAHKHNDATTTKNIRKFIKIYIHITYQIPQKEITENISLNITINYNKSTNVKELSLFHNLIIKAHSHNTKNQ